MHGVMTDMADHYARRGDGGVCGRVLGAYSVVLPLLNTDFRTSGKIVGDDHFGSISWSGSSPYEVDMTERQSMPRSRWGRRSYRRDCRTTSPPT